MRKVSRQTPPYATGKWGSRPVFDRPNRFYGFLGLIGLILGTLGNFGKPVGFFLKCHAIARPFSLWNTKSAYAPAALGSCHVCLSQHLVTTVLAHSRVIDGAQFGMQHPESWHFVWHIKNDS